MPLSLEKAIDGYLDYLKFQKRYSPHTVLSYKTDLQSFQLFLRSQFEHQDVQGLKPAYVRTWLASLKEEGNVSKTINRKISSLKSFFKYQLKLGEISVSPMATIISPKVGKRLPQYVEKTHVSTLFDHITFSEGWDGETERLIFLLFYHTGMRQAELLGLRDNSLDTYNKVLKVLGKGSKERVIPVCDELSGAIQDYMLKKKEQFEHAGDRLLQTRQGKNLYPKYVYLVVRKYLSMVTTLEKKSPHILRHTFATHLTANGADLNAVKELLGHSSLAATQIYTHNSIERLREIHNQAHPKS